MSARRATPPPAAAESELFRFDARRLVRPGVRLLAGVDEAGRGALAGPVVVGVVVVDRRFRIDGLNDSKLLSPRQREALHPLILARARAAAVGWASAQEIDRINILQATLLAAGRALDALSLAPDLILTDFLKLTGRPAPVEPLVHGDARSQAVAAASVLAKVTRDGWMRELEAEYPGYGFAAHKGYGAASHREALRTLGASTLHRHSFQGVDWFEQDYRRSVTCGELDTAIRSGRCAPGDLETAWRARGLLLPDCELEWLRTRTAP